VVPTVIKDFKNFIILAFLIGGFFKFPRTKLTNFPKVNWTRMKRGFIGWRVLNLTGYH